MLDNKKYRTDRKKNKEVENSSLVNNIVNKMQSKTDPNGSYTGVPLNENEVPVQDADDL